MDRIEEFSTTYEQRDNAPNERLVNETKTAINISFNNLEYLLGNGDFEGEDEAFVMMEKMRLALGEMIEEIEEQPYDEL